MDADENFFFTKIATKVEKFSFQRGYTVLSYALGDMDELTVQEVLNLLLAYGVDGIILNCGNDKRIEDIIDRIHVPVVMIERPAEVYEVEKVLIDNIAGSYAATNRLYERGHRKIAYLGEVCGDLVEQERYDGYFQAMKKINHEYALRHSYFTEFYSVECGYQKCMEIIKNTDIEDRPTAIFAASDILAAGVYRALMELNIKIPDEMSVVGFDDTIAQFMSPPLSTLRLPIEEIVEAALDMLIGRIEEKNGYTGNKTVKINPVYISRQSVGEVFHITDSV